MKSEERFAQAAVAVTETLLGVKVTGTDYPDSSRKTMRVVCGDRNVIVTRRPNAQRARLEAHVLYALRAHGASVPRVLAFDGTWLIQEDLGGHRLSQVLRKAGEKDGEAWLDAAIRSLAGAHRAGEAAGLHKSVVTIGRKPHWIPQLLDIPNRLGRLLDLPPPVLAEAKLKRVLQVRRPCLIKWDARPANAIAREDGTVAWFDWEHCGCRNRLDDIGWLLADEMVPDWPEVEERLFERHLWGFTNHGDSFEEAMTYLAVFGTLHTCVRLSLILRPKKQGDTNAIPAKERFRRAPKTCQGTITRAARWAARESLTEELTPWFEKILDRLTGTEGSSTARPQQGRTVPSG